MSSQIVIDASACVELLIGAPLAERIADAVRDAKLFAPDILTAEVLQALRGLERGGLLSETRASLAVQRLRESSVVRMPTQPLAGRIWALRANLSSYDACYVALADVLNSPLLSTDTKLARAPIRGVSLMLLA